MRNKVIIGIVAFVATFGLAVAVTPSGRNRVTRMYQNRIVHVNHDPKGCVEGEQTEVQRKISALLVQDAENAHATIDRRDWVADREDPTVSPYLSVEYAGFVSEYFSKSSAMDTSGLPEDFQAAWSKHFMAWQQQATFLTKISASSVGRRSNSGAFSRPIESFKKNNEEISNTWATVLCLAHKYGADIPEGAE